MSKVYGMLAGSQYYWKCFEIELSNGDQETGWRVQATILNRVVLGSLKKKETRVQQLISLPAFSLSFSSSIQVLPIQCLSPSQDEGIPENPGAQSYCPVCRTGYIINRAQCKREISALVQNHYRFQVGSSIEVRQGQGPSHTHMKWLSVA